MSDETTRVIEAQRGSNEAFTELVETYQLHVYNLCYRMLGNRQSAEDAAQETFLRAYQHLHRYDQKRPFATWLLSIAAHNCIDHLRKRRFSFTSLDQGDDRDQLELPDSDAPNPESEVLLSEKRDQIQGALKHLDSIDRAAIVLRYWHECSEAEIAENLHLTVSAVKSRLHRARRELADIWQNTSRQPNHERRPNESPAF